MSAPSEAKEGQNGKVWGSKPGARPVLHEARILLVNLKGVGFNYKAEPLEAAAAFDETEQAKILKDVHRAGVRLAVAEGLTDDVSEALALMDLGVEAVNGHKIEDRDKIKTTGDLTAFARRSVYIADVAQIITPVDPTHPLRRSTQGFIVSPRPAESTSFGKIIVVDISPDGTKIVMHVDGQQAATFEFADKRHPFQLATALDKARSVDTRCAIRLPDTTIGVTTLAQEVSFLQDERASRLRDFTPPQGKPEEAALKVLLQHSEEGVVVSATDRRRLEGQIQPFISKGVPIPVSLSLAIGTRIKNPLKFREADNLPTYGWAHFGNVMATIGEKIQRFHKAGVRVVVFDEAPLFGPLMGIPEDEIRQHQEATKRILAAVGAPVEIISLTPDMFPADRVRTMPTAVDNDKVYSIVCSRADMTNPEVMDPLYAENGRQTRNYSTLRQMVGNDVWNDSRSKAEEIARHLEYRKRAGLFDHLLGGPVAVDATITDKDGRVVFDVTSNALFNHAIPVVRRDSNGLHKVSIVPEYRVGREFPTAKPVKIDKTELGAARGMMTFYYEAR